MKRIHVISLGCPKNLVDSEVMLGLLEEDGWLVVDEPTKGDVLLLNTCGFIQPAVEEAIEEILEHRARKGRALARLDELELRNRPGVTVHQDLETLANI